GVESCRVLPAQRGPLLVADGVSGVALTVSCASKVSFATAGSCGVAAAGEGAVMGAGWRLGRRLDGQLRVEGVVCNGGIVRGRGDGRGVRRRPRRHGRLDPDAERG